MRTFRNFSFLLLLCSIAAPTTTEGRPVGCDRPPSQAGTFQWISSDPGNYNCDVALGGFCDECPCDYGINWGESGCDWDPEIFYDPNLQAYFVEDFTMHCECTLSDR